MSVYNAIITGSKFVLILQLGHSAGGDAEMYIMRENPVRGYTHAQWEMVVDHHAVVRSHSLSLNLVDDSGPDRQTSIATGCNMLFPSFLIYASLSGLVTVSMTANAKQIQCKLRSSMHALTCD